MKFNYSASFSDGETIIRTSPRIYTHAWKCGNISGFSGTLALATAQVKSYKKSRKDAICEIVAVTTETAEVVKTFKTENPWKVRVTYRSRQTGWLKAGANRIARYPTESDAQAIIDRFTGQNVGNTYKIIRD